MGRIIVIYVSVAMLMAGTEASAAGRRQQRIAERTNGANVPPLATQERGPTAAMNYGRYPKFIGGFHSREIQNVGIPSGDQGLRGNSISIYPW